jgi:hypothetical protein
VDELHYDLERDAVRYGALLGRHTGPELAAMLAAIGPKAIRARHRVPGLVRRQRIGRMNPEEPLPDDRLS